MSIILFFGAPGSGKGTQADLLKKSFSIGKISPGDVVRSMLISEKDSDIAMQIKQQMGHGNLISSKIINAIISSSIKSNAEKGLHSLLDGYPRSIDQDDYMRQNIDKNLDTVKLAIYLEIDNERLISRLKNRITCYKCNAIYNKISIKTIVNNVCNVCGESNFFTRSDDVDEGIMQRRFDVFMTETMPVIERYKAEDKLKIIKADQEPLSMFAEICKTLSKFSELKLLKC